LPASIVLTGSPVAIPPGGTKAIYAYVTGPEDFLLAYELIWSVTEGTSGTLIVDSLEIDTTRSDFLFHDLPSLTGKNVAGARLLGAVTTGQGGYAAEEMKYLAKVVLRASSDASGTFTLALKTPGTSVRGSGYHALTWNSTPKMITVSVPPEEVP